MAKHIVSMILLGAAALVEARAGAIQYIFTGTASGTLNGSPFQGRQLTLTAVGNTSDVTLAVDVYFNNVAARARDVDGIIHHTSSKIGYGVNGIPNCCDIIQFVNVFYATYDLKSATAVFPYPSDLSIGDWVDVPTSLGPLTLRSYNENTFHAAAAPEPGTMALFGLGLMLCAAGASIRRKPGS